MRRLLLCLALVAIADRAVACINDNELPSHEREFRSEYLVAAAPVREPSVRTSRPRTELVTAAGAAMLASAVVLAWVGSRPRS
jgi:hypothetical protein